MLSTRGKEHPENRGLRHFDVISGGCGINVTLIIFLLGVVCIAEVPYTLRIYLLSLVSTAVRAASQAAFIIAFKRHYCIKIDRSTATQLASTKSESELHSQ